MPMFTIDSEEAAQLTLQFIFGGAGGIPRWVLTDNGSEFKGAFDSLCQKLQIEHKVSAPGHAQSHGMVERLVATTELTLAHFLDEDMTAWTRCLPWAQASHNAEPHPALAMSTTQAYTPAESKLSICGALLCHVKGSPTSSSQGTIGKQNEICRQSHR